VGGEEVCAFCEGVHAPQLPCFIQPRAYGQQLQLGDFTTGEPPPLLSPQPPALPVEEEEEEWMSEGEEAATPPPTLWAEAERPARAPLQFLWWDVESEQLEAAAQQQPPGQPLLKHVPILICAEVMCERFVCVCVA
jgi:hypothetical protein